MATPRQQLTAMIKKYDPAIARLAEAVLIRMRRRLPGAIELVYDNYNTLAIGYSPSEKASEAIFSIALYPRWISLFFFYGSRLSDPDRLLRGKGKLARHVVLKSASDLDDPVLDALIEQSLEIADPTLDDKQKNRIVIKSISARQRPRRPK